MHESRALEQSQCRMFSFRALVCATLLGLRLSLGLQPIDGEKFHLEDETGISYTKQSISLRAHYILTLFDTAEGVLNHWPEICNLHTGDIWTPQAKLTRSSVGSLAGSPLRHKRSHTNI